jgi:histidine triad (HIT) family protein
VSDSKQRDAARRARDPNSDERDPNCIFYNATILTAPGMASRPVDRLSVDGVNLLNSCGPAAWQTVFHFHMHVIPRYYDDPLRLPWTPTQGDREEIEAAAAALR